MLMDKNRDTQLRSTRVSFMRNRKAHICTINMIRRVQISPNSSNVASPYRLPLIMPNRISRLLNLRPLHTPAFPHSRIASTHNLLSFSVSALTVSLNKSNQFTQGQGEPPLWSPYTASTSFVFPPAVMTFTCNGIMGVID